MSMTVCLDSNLGVTQIGLTNLTKPCRYGPSMTHGQNAYRWFSSLLIYRSFVQLGSNLLLILGLGIHLERRYGTRRLMLLTAITGVGGNFFSAAFEVRQRHALACLLKH